jgi:diacylglycerol kinase family enzyme
MLAVIVSNTRLYAGGLFNLSPHAASSMTASWTSGFCAVAIRHTCCCTARLSWLGGIPHRPDIIHLSGRHVIIETETPQPFHLDGELNRNTPITCTVEPGLLRILAPQGAPADLFVQEGVGLVRTWRIVNASLSTRDA